MMQQRRQGKTRWVQWDGWDGTESAEQDDMGWWVATYVLEGGTCPPESEKAALPGARSMPNSFAPLETLFPE